MEDPHGPQHDAAQQHGMHHQESHAHEQGDHHHDAHLGSEGHAPAGHIAFQIVFVQAGGTEPAVQSFGTSAEAESRQEQEGKGRQQGQLLLCKKNEINLLIK